MTYRKKRTEIAVKRLFQWYLKKVVAAVVNAFSPGPGKVGTLRIST